MPAGPVGMVLGRIASLLVHAFDIDQSIGYAATCLPFCFCKILIFLCRMASYKMFQFYREPSNGKIYAPYELLSSSHCILTYH